MEPENEKPRRHQGLRKRAERKIQFETVPLHRMSDADVAALCHELRVHEVELEMQNEELRRAQVELEQSRSKYADLFDLAPLGYFVFDDKGCILEVNLTGASMLQKDRRDLLGKPFNLFVDGRDKDHFRQHRAMVFETGTMRQCEIRLLRPEVTEMVARLRSRPMTDPNDENKVIACRTSITNITALAHSQRRLRTSEQRFRTLAENAPDIITRMDRDLRIVYINRRITEATGVPTDQIIGRTPEELEMPEHVCAVWAREVRRIFDTGRTAQFEFDYPTNKGLRNFHASLTPERDDDGTISTVLWVARDVTEAKQAQQALAQREEQLRLTVEGGDLGTWYRDLRTDEIMWGERLYELLGRDPNGPPVTGETFFDYIHPDDLPRVRRHLEETLASGEEFVDEFRIVRDDGQQRWLASVGRIYRNAQGQPVRMSGVNYDITDRRNAELQLGRSEEKFHSLFRSMSEASVLFELIRDDAGEPVDCRVIEANPATETMTGLTPSEAVGRTMREIFPDADQFWFDVYGKVEATGEPVTFERRFEPLDRIYHTRVYRPSPGHVAIVFMDITTRKQTEEALRREHVLLNSVMQTTDVMLALLDPQFNFVWVNAAYARTCAEDPAELIGQNHFALYPDAENEAVFRRVRDTGEPVFLKDKPFTFPDRPQRGVTYWDWSLMPMHDEAQKVTGLVFSLRETTEFVRAAEALRSKEERLRVASESGRVGMWSADIASGQWEFDRQALRLFGLPEDAPVTIEQVRALTHPGDRTRLDRQSNKARSAAGEHEFEYRIVRPDGATRWMLLRGRTDLDEEGRPQRNMGVVMDITDRKQAEEAVENLARFPAENPSPVLRLGHDGEIRYANRPAAILLDQWQRAVGERAPEHWCRAVDTALRYGRTSAEEAQADGRTLALALAPVIDGGYVNIYGMDITERRQAEQALQEAHDRLEDRVEERTIELQQTVEVLQQEVAEKVKAQNHVARQKEVLQKIVDNIPVMLCFYDADGDVGLINEEFRRVLGHTLEDLQEDGVMELCYPDPKERQEAWEFMMRAEPGWRDFFVQNKEGRKVASSWANVRLSDCSYVGIGIDVRQRKRFENRIKESEERYRTLVELSPDGIGVERDGVIRFVNATVRRLLGAEKGAELVGREVLDFVHPDYRRRTGKQLEYLRRRRKPLRVAEAKVVRLDGTVLDVELSAIPIAYKNKPATQIVMRDITQRKEAEARLRDNAIQLQQQAELLDLAHDTILMQDMDGVITFWNQGAANTYGWTKEEAVGRNSHKLLNTRLPSRVMDITAALLRDGRWNGELTHTTRSGKTLIVSSRWALQRDEEGAPAGILEIDRDITQRKRAEQESFEARRFAESVIETIQEALVVLDADLRVLAANRAFYDTFEDAELGFMRFGLQISFERVEKPDQTTPARPSS